MPFPVWVLIALVFFYFAFMFWYYSRHPIRDFTVRDRGENASDERFSDKKEIVADILKDFQGYLDAINKRNTVRYRVAALGFAIAGLTALVAIFL